MKKLLLLFFICPTIVIAQPRKKHIAYRQIISASQNKIIKLTYTKSYSSQQDSVYITKYTIYDYSGKPFVFIIANHDKKNQHVSVDVEDAQGGVFSHIHTEEYDYQEPTEKYFGIAGNYRALGGNKFPYQLSLFFPDAKHERINVVMTNATDYKYQDGNYITYILKDEMLPSEVSKSKNQINSLPEPLRGLKAKTITTTLSRAEILKFYEKYHLKNIGENYFYLPLLTSGTDSCILVQIEQRGKTIVLKFSNQCG